MNIAAFIVLLLIAKEGHGSTYIISEEFHTHHFTNNDFNAWTLSGSSLPPRRFTTCGTARLFGGYQVFVGDPTSPTQASRTWTNLIPHHSVRIVATVYKIDSWPGASLFLMVDGVNAASQYFDSSNGGSSDFCGSPNPIPDSVNTNYNDLVINIDITIPHTTASLVLSFVSNLQGTRGAWGIRQLNVTMEACDQSCQSCSNSTSCDSCPTGLVQSGPFCVCSTGLRQKQVPCSLSPCVSCVSPSCSAGWYLSPITTFCQPCNIACSTCTDSTNTISTCPLCSTGYIGNPSGGVVCSSCFSGCLTCTSTSANTCSSCQYTYFHYSANSSCLSSCPSGFFGEEKTARCFSCLSPCLDCMGIGGSPYFCLSCITNYYLWQNSCSLQCPNFMFGYQGNCLVQCPSTTFSDTSTYTCSNCIADCAQCSSSLTCNKCNNGSYLSGGVCYAACPAGYYGDTSIFICLQCDSSCLSCDGSSSTSCLSCSSGVAVNGSCHTSCPNNTYSAACLACDPSCLSCSGPSAGECLSCPSPSFHHLNDSTCLSSCSLGEVSDNMNLNCIRCPSGQTSYYSLCNSCDPSCLSCWGISFLQCSSCDNSSSLVNSACVINRNSQAIYAPDVSSSENVSTIRILFIIFIVVTVVVEIIFSYKTPLLTTLQLCQILSYSYYLSVKLTQNTQNSALFLYNTNFAFLVNPFPNTINHKIPPKFQVIGKTGYFFSDAFGVHVCMLIVSFVLLAMKGLSGRFKLMKTLYAKVNPYLVTYTFRLVILELSLALFLFLYCFELNSGMGGASLGLILVDVFLLLSAICWRVRSDSDGSQVAIFYNNEIGVGSQNTQYQEQTRSQLKGKIKANSILPSILLFSYKIFIPLIVITFVDNPLVQNIALCVYSILCLCLSLLFPYRRRIYKFTVICNGIFLVINGLVGVAVSRGTNSSLFQLVWIVAISLSLLLTSLQVIFNYHFFISFFYFLKYRCEEWLKEEEPSDRRNEESQSNITDDFVLEKERKDITATKNFSKVETLSPGKIKHNNIPSSDHLNISKISSENEVHLDLNL